jgi:hypothetical protein
MERGTNRIVVVEPAQVNPHRSRFEVAFPKRSSRPRFQQPAVVVRALGRPITGLEATVRDWDARPRRNSTDRFKPRLFDVVGVKREIHRQDAKNAKGTGNE